MSKRGTLMWLTLIFTLFLVLAIYSFHKKNPLLLVGSEIVIPLLYAITIGIMIRSLKPISAIGRSLNLLKEGDFNITMIKTGNSENGLTEVLGNDLSSKAIVIKGAYNLLMKMKNTEE